MTITGAIVLYAITWFMVFFIVLPLRFRSQADAGLVEPGTPASAPADAVVGRKARITTLWASLVWAVLVAVILSGRIGIDDLDIFGVWG